MHIGRKCNGSGCPAELDLRIEQPDQRGEAGIKAHLQAFVAAAALLGWRVINPSNASTETHRSPLQPSGYASLDDEQFVVPAHGNEVFCPACASARKLVCYRCHNAECSCMGGPHFSAREG